uniref:Uncharacterized protein n=1 Tax=Pseudo-nitzschia australis TaxID=44445 RepID=A0A7S4AMP6_9STRA|mmetsp:Transcript_17206/g.37644  ORF Transcript_17206/g.37644 Transcript_17206/m.37644 type:complete len:260 (+) Transcript_17206:175-954(+)
MVSIISGDSRIECNTMIADENNANDDFGSLNSKGSYLQQQQAIPTCLHRIRSAGDKRKRRSQSYPPLLNFMTVLLVIAVTIGDGNALDAIGNDPEGIVREDNDGVYRYYPATTNAAPTSHIVQDVVVVHETDFYSPGGGYWHNNATELEDRADSGSEGIQGNQSAAPSNSNSGSNFGSSNGSNFSDDTKPRVDSWVHDAESTPVESDVASTTLQKRTQPPKAPKREHSSRAARPGSIRGGAGAQSHHRRRSRITKMGKI